MIIKNPDKKQFKELTTKGKTVVDFWATWCNPCRVQGEILEKFAAEHPDIAVVKIDIDENEDMAQEFMITAVPTLMFYSDGSVIDKRLGVTEAAIMEQIFSS